jgi:O-antigen/teichoic acid export membrane protein
LIVKVNDGARRRARSGHSKGPVSLLSGTAVLVGGRFVVAALGWAGTLLIVRSLTPPQWGGYSFVFSLLGVLGILSDLRVGRLALAAMMKDPEPGSVVGSYIGLRFVLGVLSYLVAVAVVALGNYPAEVVTATVVAGLVLVIAALSSSLDMAFQASMWYSPIALAAILGQLAQLILTIVIAVAWSGTMVRFAIPAVLFEIVAVSLKYLLVRQRMDIIIRPRYREWLSWLKEAIPLVIGSAMATVYFRIDAIMLSKMDSLTSVGLYNIGYKFSDVLAIVPFAVLSAILPLLVSSWPDDIARFRQAFQASFTLLVVAAVGFTVGFAGVARPVIGLLYGRQYEVAASAAIGLVAGQSLRFFTSLEFYVLMATKRNRAYALAASLGVVVNVGLNLVLIPQYSYAGAAMATILTEVIVLLSLVGPVGRVAGIRPLNWGMLAKVLLAGMMMLGVVFGLRTITPWPVMAAAAAVVYLGALHLLRVEGPGGLLALVRKSRFEAPSSSSTR